MTTKTSITSKTILNEQEAAAHIGMSRSFLRHHRCEGFVNGKTQGPEYIKIGRTIRYKSSDLDAWLNFYKIGPKR